MARRWYPYRPYLTKLARQLRNNCTKSEAFLWQYLKGRYDGIYDFHRQKPLDRFIADFICIKLQLVIELDGSVHDSIEAQEKDREKEVKLNQLGLNVLRFRNSEVLENTSAVLDIISEYAVAFEGNDLGKLKGRLNCLSGSDPILRDGRLYGHG